MKNSHILSGPEQIKVLASPLRRTILEAMIPEPITTKQVADRLGEQPTKLYHHVEALERAGLVRLVKKKPKRGTVEKYFQAVAQRFVVERDAIEVAVRDGEEAAALEGVVSGSLDETLAEIRDGIASGIIRTEEDAGESIFVRSHLRATPVQMSKLVGALNRWVRECQIHHDPDAELEYGLTVAFYPTRLAK